MRSFKLPLDRQVHEVVCEIVSASQANSSREAACMGKTL